MFRANATYTDSIDSADGTARAESCGADRVWQKRCRPGNAGTTGLKPSHPIVASVHLGAVQGFSEEVIGKG